ncbi:MAG: DEAD/DEAH box helicase family protein, partial [Syntrophomonadaceae bacterium]|nr:DEAD/DEAH box helicase family protein [Syntrophomonadaceae bacterium]
KTLIAKGVIAKTALYHQHYLNDELFKVVYVCSNQSIAAQNLRKLKINDSDRVDNVSDTRLSMQHLRIFEDERTAKECKNYIQLIPLTPSTSFNITSGGGSVRERALIFAVLSRYPGLKECVNGLEMLMEDYATQSWKSWAKNHYEERVAECDKDSNYMQTVLARVDDYFKNDAKLLNQTIEICRRTENSNQRQEDAYNVIYRLRQMMAEISVELMDPDLVIMDEFQRFPELIKTDLNDETGIIARRFFNAPKRDNKKVKILLLSATPYKLYSTLEEINENRTDEHYQDFTQLMNFLFESDLTAKATFSKAWSNYSISLSEISISDITILHARKTEAENALYQGICRTERLSIEGADKLVDIQAAKSSLSISEKDVTSYIAAYNLLRSIGLNEHVPVDYIKSAPYIFSFMQHYKLKTKTYDYFRRNSDKLQAARKPELWINENLIAQYEKLPDTNARIKRLKDEALMPGAERLIWVPPSRPYYEAGGPFTRMKDFSKVLVFSAWEMVPRAIATLVSYEAERRTVGELIKKSPNPEKENRSYFPGIKKVRFPAPRLKFSIRDGKPANMALMTLLYPSVTLAEAYNPIEAMNSGMKRRRIESEIRCKLAAKLDLIKHNPKGNEDERWYSLAPVLLDFDKD